MKPRADVFKKGGTDFDLSDFQPKEGVRSPAIPMEAIKAVSEAADFRSRDPGPNRPRRYKTGRNQQLNIKATAETIALFGMLADKNGWSMAETLEQALAALQKLQNSGD